MVDANGGGGGADSGGTAMLIKGAHTDDQSQLLPSVPPSSMEHHSLEETEGDKSQSEKVRRDCFINK